MGKLGKSDNDGAKDSLLFVAPSFLSSVVSSPTTSFRVAGDVFHVVAVLAIILGIVRRGSAKGISGKQDATLQIFVCK